MSNGNKDIWQNYVEYIAFIIHLQPVYSQNNKRNGSRFATVWVWGSSNFDPLIAVENNKQDELY